MYITGYNQGVFSSVLTYVTMYPVPPLQMLTSSNRMYNFDHRMGDAVTNTNTKGWLVSVLELGAWFGVLCTGYLADKLSRKYSIVLG